MCEEGLDGASGEPGAFWKETRQPGLYMAEAHLSSKNHELDLTVFMTQQAVNPKSIYQTRLHFTWFNKRTGRAIQGTARRCEPSDNSLITLCDIEELLELVEAASMKYFRHRAKLYRLIIQVKRNLDKPVERKRCKP